MTKGDGPNSCSNVVTDDVLRSRCCCSVGAAWNNPCEECPKNGTGKAELATLSGLHNVTDHGTIVPKRFLRLAENMEGKTVKG